MKRANARWWNNLTRLSLLRTLNVLGHWDEREELLLFQFYHFVGHMEEGGITEKLELWIKFVYFVMFMSLSLAFPSFILCNCLCLYYAFFFYFSVLWRIITICLVGCGTFEHALHKLSNSMKDTTTLKSTANNKKKKISFEIVTNEVSTSAPLMIKSQIHNIQMKMDRHKFKRKKVPSCLFSCLVARVWDQATPNYRWRKCESRKKK